MPYQKEFSHLPACRVRKPKTQHSDPVRIFEIYFLNRSVFIL
ncbi:conserved hypothetical protein [Burkholderia latens]